MKVRILSGQHAGQITDLEGSELEVNLTTGFAELVTDVPVSEPVVKNTPPDQAEIRAAEPAAPGEIETDAQRERRLMREAEAQRHPPDA